MEADRMIEYDYEQLSSVKRRKTETSCGTKKYVNFNLEIDSSKTNRLIQRDKSTIFNFNK